MNLTNLSQIGKLNHVYILNPLCLSTHTVVNITAEGQVLPGYDETVMMPVVLTDLIDHHTVPSYHL